MRVIQQKRMHFEKKLWIARYGRKKPKKDAYVGCLMELKYLAEGGTLDIGGKKKRQAARIAADMYLNSPEVQEDRYPGKSYRKN